MSVSFVYQVLLSACICDNVKLWVLPSKDLEQWGNEEDR